MSKKILLKLDMTKPAEEFVALLSDPELAVWVETTYASLGSARASFPKEVYAEVECDADTD